MNILSTRSGKALIVALGILLTGVAARVAHCPWAKGIMIVGLIVAVIALVVYSRSKTFTD